MLGLKQDVVDVVALSTDHGHTIMFGGSEIGLHRFKQGAGEFFHQLLVLPLRVNVLGFLCESWRPLLFTGGT